MKTSTTPSEKFTPKKAIILLLPVIFALIAALSVAFLVQGGLKQADEPTPPPAESSTEPEELEVMLPLESDTGEEYSRGLKFRSNGDGTAAVTGIGSCTDREVVIPTNTPEGDLVIAIGSEAFKGITAIGEIFLPDSIMTIGEDAFRESGLVSVNLGGTVVSIGKGAFADCPSLTAINVSAANAMYSSADGVLFDREMTEIICYPSGKSIRRYTIPSSVTRIAPSAFSSAENLKEIVFDGTEKEWKNVYVCSGNESLHSATLSFARSDK